MFLHLWLLLLEFVTLQGGPSGQLCFLVKSTVMVHLSDLVFLADLLAMQRSAFSSICICCYWNFSLYKEGLWVNFVSWGNPFAMYQFDLVSLADFLARYGISAYICERCYWKFFFLQGGPVGQLCFLIKSNSDGSFVLLGLLCWADGRARGFLLILVNVAIGIRHFTRRAFGSALFLDEIHLRWITCLIWPLSLFDSKAREFLFLHLWILLLEFVNLQGGPLGQLCVLTKSICGGSLVWIGLHSWVDGEAKQFLFLQLCIAWNFSLYKEGLWVSFVSWVNPFAMDHFLFDFDHLCQAHVILFLVWFGISIACWSYPFHYTNLFL